MRKRTRFIPAMLPALLATLALALPAALAGCDGDESASGTGPTTRPGGGQGKPVVGFSQIGAESAWRIANTESIKSEAEARGIDLRFADAQQKQENQIRALRSFITQGVDVIAFSPVVTTGWEPVLREIKDAGIPVILTDRAVDVSDESLYACFIGADFVEEGRRAGRWLAEATGGKATIVELQGTPGSAPAIDRKKGFEEVIAQYPEMRIIKSQTGNFERAKGREVMEAFLKSPEGSQITALYAHNDDMALGAIQAIEAAGRRPGQDIRIVSIDAIRDAFQAMAEGKLNCTVECNPLLGPQLFDLIEAFLKSPEGSQITALYAHNDDMALGAIQAIEAAGRRPGEDIRIVSIDAIRDAFQAMAEGKLNCTVECNPLLGPQLFDLIEALHRGEEIPKRVVVEEGVFTQDQAAELLPSRKY